MTGDKNGLYTPEFTEDTPISALLERNAVWAAKQAKENPEMIQSLSHSQSPKILWIGCSDSRVPETTILDLAPGDVFVHRNIANVVSATDMSVLSVIQFAVEVLKVNHVIVCGRILVMELTSGHTDCGGCKASLKANKLGLIDNWLRHIRDVRAQYADQLDALPVQEQTVRLAELKYSISLHIVNDSVIQQVYSTMRVPTIQEAMATRGLQVHGWIYEVESGRVRELTTDKDSKFDCYKVLAH
jgi:carbonic anhydrase